MSAFFVESVKNSADLDACVPTIDTNKPTLCCTTPVHLHGDEDVELLAILNNEIRQGYLRRDLPVLKDEHSEDSDELNEASVPLEHAGDDERLANQEPETINENEDNNILGQDNFMGPEEHIQDEIQALEDINLLRGVIATNAVPIEPNTGGILRDRVVPQNDNNNVIISGPVQLPVDLLVELENSFFDVEDGLNCSNDSQ